MHLPLESLADNSCFHCTKILFHAMENKVSPIIRKSKGLLFQNEAFIFSLGFQNEAFNFHQNTSVTQTAFKWHLNDAFLFDSQSKITPKIHCQFGKISYLYIVVKMPFCTLFHLLS